MPAYLSELTSTFFARNKAASEIFLDFSETPEDQRNTLYQMFTSGELRERDAIWE